MTHLWNLIRKGLIGSDAWIRVIYMYMYFKPNIGMAHTFGILSDRDVLVQIHGFM